VLALVLAQVRHGLRAAQLAAVGDLVREDLVHQHKVEGGGGGGLQRLLCGGGLVYVERAFREMLFKDVAQHLTVHPHVVRDKHAACTRHGGGSEGGGDGEGGGGGGGGGGGRAGEGS